MNAASPVRRGYVEAAGLQLHYRVAGEQGAPPLLLLHQSPSSSAMYETLMELLADRYYLVAPDTPGFGDSDPLPLSPERLEIADYARALQAFSTALDLGPCYVFGHHTGAAIAVQLEHDFPGFARRLALSGPTLLSAEQRDALPALAADIPLEGQGQHLQAMWQRIRDKDPEAPLALSQRELISAFNCGAAYSASYAAVARQDFAALLPAIACPVLVFAGDRDPLYRSVAPTLERLQRGQGLDLPGGEGTYVCERQASIVAAALADFFGAAGD